MNFKGDKYPIFMGQMDSGTIDDDTEEYLGTIWNDVLLSRGPVDSSNYPGLNHSQKDVIVANAHAILFKVFAN